MEYVVRKYCQNINSIGKYKTCIGIQGYFDNKREAEKFYWNLNVEEFRINKYFLYKSKFGIDPKYRFEREYLVKFINEKYPFANEYYYPDTNYNLHQFNIPDEITDSEIIELSTYMNISYYELSESKNQTLFYIPVPFRKIRNSSDKYNEIDFPYFGETEYGTRAFTQESIARFEFEEYLTRHRFKIEKDEISDSYKILKLNSEEYINFRFNELSEKINETLISFKALWGEENIFERLSNEFQLPVRFLKKKFNTAPNKV